MAVRVAYGNRDDVPGAISAGIIPQDSIIITKELDGCAELMFYDALGNLKPVAERSRFVSFTEAQTWARQYNCAGHIYSIHNGSGWSLYIVQDDFRLTPIDSADISIDDVERIDGGTAFGSR